MLQLLDRRAYWRIAAAPTAAKLRFSTKNGGGRDVHIHTNFGDYQKCVHKAVLSIDHYSNVTNIIEIRNQLKAASAISNKRLFRIAVRWPHPVAKESSSSAPTAAKSLG